MRYKIVIAFTVFNKEIMITAKLIINNIHIITSNFFILHTTPSYTHFFKYDQYEIPVLLCVLVVALHLKSTCVYHVVTFFSSKEPIYHPPGHPFL